MVWEKKHNRLVHFVSNLPVFCFHFEAVFRYAGGIFVGKCGTFHLSLSLFEETRADGQTVQARRWRKERRHLTALSHVTDPDLTYLGYAKEQRYT